MEKAWCKQNVMPNVYSQKKNGTTCTFKLFGTDVNIAPPEDGTCQKTLSLKPLAEKAS
jgi:hypothetical protein